LKNIKTGEAFHLFSVNLKTDQGAANEEARLQEATILRAYLDSLPAGSLFIAAGDWNVYTESEPMYVLMTGKVTSGRLFDPTGRGGDWHDNENFAMWHTQSTHLTTGGGAASGGMDDRFDQILISQAMRSHYLQGSYTTFGNDGQHLNNAINVMPNNAVDSVMAQALYDASDHLPVFADFILEEVPSGVEENQEEVLQGREMDLSDRLAPINRTRGRESGTR
jgi:hypothetical protein